MLPYYLALDPFLQQQQQHHHLTVAYALFLPLPVILSVLSPLLSLSMAAQTVEEGWALPTLPPARLWTPHPTPTPAPTPTNGHNNCSLQAPNHHHHRYCLPLRVYTVGSESKRTLWTTAECRQHW